MPPRLQATDDGSVPILFFQHDGISGKLAVAPKIDSDKIRYAVLLDGDHLAPRCLKF